MQGAQAGPSRYPHYGLYATRSKLEQAKKDGIIDVILNGIGEELLECDIIFLCTPVEYNAQYLSAIRPYLKPGALITDVGSTKTDIHEEILRQGLSHCFVGGHPMAGSEKTGYEHSTDHLLENAYYIVTPPEGLTEPLHPIRTTSAVCWQWLRLWEQSLWCWITGSMTG